MTKIRGGRQTTENWLRIDFFTLTTYFGPAESESVVKSILSHQEVMFSAFQIVAFYLLAQNLLIHGRSGMYVWFSTDQAKSKNQFFFHVWMQNAERIIMSPTYFQLIFRVNQTLSRSTCDTKSLARFYYLNDVSIYLKRDEKHFLETR